MLQTFFESEDRWNNVLLSSENASCGRLFISFGSFDPDCDRLLVLVVWGIFVAFAKQSFHPSNQVRCTPRKTLLMVQ